MGVFVLQAVAQLFSRCNHRHDLLLCREAQFVKVLGVQGAFHGHHQRLVGQQQGQDLVLDRIVLGDQRQHFRLDAEACQRHHGNVQLVGHGQGELFVGQRTHLDQDLSQHVALAPA